MLTPPVAGAVGGRRMPNGHHPGSLNLACSLRTGGSMLPRVWGAAQGSIDLPELCRSYLCYSSAGSCDHTMANLSPTESRACQLTSRLQLLVF